MIAEAPTTRSRWLARTGTVVVVLALAGCAGAPTRSGGPAALPPAPARAFPQSPAPRAAIARLALDMVGIPYRYGGSSPSEGFDCSGLVFYTYTRAGVAVPRTAEDLFEAAEKIAPDRAAAGDLVFFQDQRKLSHVGIYVGDDLFVHAPSSGSTVRVSSLDSQYYRRHLVGVGRLLPE